MNNIFFTKSAYKIAIDCPTKLYYCCDKQYANQDEGNEFLQSLANGGFQVGELAKLYYHIGEDTCIRTKDYEESLTKTAELFRRENINIAEAAFKFGNLFVRADIIEKTGTHINLIEVKAKSYSSDSSTIITRDNAERDVIPYVKDVAFQKYVITSALKEKYPKTPFTVHAYLMMADKATQAPVNGMNQYFKINSTDEGERITIINGAENLANEQHILTAFDVDDFCDEIISAPDYVSSIDYYADCFCTHRRLSSDLTHRCFKCPFTSPDGHLKDGFKECWKDKAGFMDMDFERPYLRDFSMYGFWQTADNLIRNKKIFLDELSLDDIESGRGAITERRIILLGLETSNKQILSHYHESIIDGKLFLDKTKLRQHLTSYKSPLHFIDFETAATALPFYKGMRPYEDVAFQYSHHTVWINDDGTYKIEHTNQFLNTQKGYFPNFDFVWSLRDALSKDDGTIFRYANHENKILRSIREQLIESNEADKDDLISFIDSITHSSKLESTKHIGERDMVDLETLVKECFLYPKYMKGRTSIKVVLPAVLNASSFLQEKYSKPIYGSEIKSCNYSDSNNAISWIKKLPQSDEIDNPYHELETIEKNILLNSGFSTEQYERLKKDVGETVANGGAALTAYSKLQYTDLVATDVLRNALFRYCELDTMAMVFIWEYFYNETR